MDTVLDILIYIGDDVLVLISVVLPPSHHGSSRSASNEILLKLSIRASRCQKYEQIKESLSSALGPSPEGK